MTLAFVSWSLGQDSQTNSKPKSTADLEICLSEPSCADARIAAHDLASKERFPFLLRRYKSADEATRAYIVEGIYGSDRGRNNDAVVEFMSGIAFYTTPQNQFDQTTWYALQFLAERCDERALERLNAGGNTPQKAYRYEVSCAFWALTLKTFGKCRYVRARETLLNSNNSSCLDIMNAAGDSLHALYPGQCMDVKTFDQASSCYTKLWSDDKKQ
jgi:hypothetical protein